MRPDRPLYPIHRGKYHSHTGPGRCEECEGTGALADGPWDYTCPECDGEGLDASHVPDVEPDDESDEPCHCAECR